MKKEVENSTNIIAIGDKKYIQREQAEGKKSYSRGSMGAFLAMYALPMMIAGGSYYKRKRPTVSILEEFKLIQEKKSNLSRNDREWVVRVFNEKYKEIL